MREITEREKAQRSWLGRKEVIDAIPEADLVLFCPALHGRGATLYDRSQNAKHGTITAATWARTPRGLWYLDFNGTTAKVDFGAQTVHRLGTKATLVCWVKLADTTVPGYILLAKEGPTLVTDYEYLFYLYDTDSDDKFHLLFNISDNGNGGDNDHRMYMYAADVIIDTNWHRVAAAMDLTLSTTSKVSFFVDGVQKTTALGIGSYLTSVYQGNADLRIGESERLSGAGWSLKGGLALPRTLSRAMSSAEDTIGNSREKLYFGV